MDLADAIRTALADHLAPDEGTTMVGPFVLTAEFYTEDGEPALVTISPPETAYWTELGLLKAAELEIKRSIEVRGD